MIIMIILLVLSALFMLFTLIYINHKRKKQIKGLKSDIPKGKKIKKKSGKQLRDILNIKVKGSIILFGTRYSSLIELGNIDYNMLSEEEQAGIENVLIQTALSIDYPIQFFSTTQNIDTSEVIKNIQTNKTFNKNIIEYQNSLIQYLTNLMENRNISVVKNYAIISFDGNYENAIDELNRRITSFTNNLLRAKIKCELLEEKEIYNLIYKELNKNPNSNIDNLLKGCEKLYVKKGKKEKRKRN